MKVTTQMNAFLSPSSSATPQSLQTEKGVRGLSYFADKDYWVGLGYTFIGVAEITVEAPDERQLIESKVIALRQEITKTRADSTAKITLIESQIQQLLCIENWPLGATVDDDECPF